MNSFYSKSELKDLGFKTVGANVLISRKASFYGIEHIEIGKNVRIDDFCIISGKVSIGRNVHVAAYSALFGGLKGIEVGDYSNISSRVCIYALSDDFSGETMTNPTIPEEYKNVREEKVYIGKHVIIGTGCTILPGVNLEEGTAIGAMSLCNKSTDAWGIYAGIPISYLKSRKKDLLKLEEDYILNFD